MKIVAKTLLALLLCLALLPLQTAALAQAPDTGTAQESIIDEDALNQWMEEYLKSHNLGQNFQEFSVGFCYTATGDCWFYNADKFMYSASMYKVPVSMLLAEKEAAGELTQDSRLEGYTLQTFSYDEFLDEFGLHPLCDHQVGEEEVGILVFKVAEHHPVVVGFHVTQFGSRLRHLCQSCLYVEHVVHFQH